MTIKTRLFAGALAAGLMASTAYASVIDRPYFRILGVVVVWGADNYEDSAGAAPVVSDFVLLTPASGNAGVDLINGDVYTVVTGTLDPISSTGSTDTQFADPVTGTGAGNVTDTNADGILDVGEFSAFTMDDTTDVSAPGVTEHNSSFYVASNAPFSIYAQSTAAVTSGDFSGTLDESNITFSLAVDATSGTETPGAGWGARSQDPSTGGTGVITAIDSLDDLTAGPTEVFEGGTRTAASAGSLAQQSVRFDATYNLDGDTSTAGLQPYDLSMGVGTIYADVTYTVYVP